MKPLAEREKKVVIAAAIVSVPVILFTYVLLPLSRTWGYQGAQLAPKKEYVRVLKERLQAQDSLMARREVLAKRLGTLLGLEPDQPNPKEDKPKEDKPAEKTVETDEKAPNEDGKDEKVETDEKAPNEDGKDEKVETDEKPPNEDGKDEKVETDEKAPDEGAKDEEKEAPVDEPADGDDVKPDGPKPESKQEETEKTADEEKETSENGEKTAENSENQSESEDTSSDKQEKSGEDEEEDSPKPDAEPDKHAGMGVGVTTHLERMVQKSGMKIKRITPKSSSSGKKEIKRFEAVSMQLSVEGNMENLLDLLFALEKGKRFTRVEQMQLRRDWSKGNTVDATLEVLAYQYNAG